MAATTPRPSIHHGPPGRRIRRLRTAVLLLMAPAIAALVQPSAAVAGECRTTIRSADCVILAADSRVFSALHHALFESVECVELATTTVSAFYAQPFDPWVRYKQEAYWVGRGKSSHKAPTNFRKAPSSRLPAGHKVLFDTPSAQCTPPLSAKTSYTNACRLGIPEDDFYLARNGWDLPFHHITHIV